MLFSVLMFAFAIAGVVQGVYKMNDAVVNSVCLVDDTYLRFNAFLDNVKVPLKLLNENFGTAVEELKDAAVQDPKLTRNIRDIGSAFDVVKEKAINNKAQVASSAMKLICDPAWDEMIAQCESAKTTIGDSADEIEQTCVFEYFFFFCFFAHSLTLSLTHSLSLSHSLTLSHTHSHTLTLSHSHTLTLS